MGGRRRVARATTWTEDRGRGDGGAPRVARPAGKDEGCRRHLVCASDGFGGKAKTGSLKPLRVPPLHLSYTGSTWSVTFTITKTEEPLWMGRGGGFSPELVFSSQNCYVKICIYSTSTGASLQLL